MAEIVEDNPTEEVNNLSDEELEERFERDLELFKKTLSRLSSE